MSMTVLVVRNASPKLCGFLASSMLEMSAGVYVLVRMSASVRDLIWDVVESWKDPNTSAVMLWRDSQNPNLVSSKLVGTPRIELVEIDGMFVSKR